MKMLPHCTRFCVSMLIFLKLCQGSNINQCYKPIISTNSKEIILNEGEPLQISCVHCGVINFVFPDDSEINSPYSIHQNVSNSIPVYTFNRSKTVFNDTGWYGCANSSVENIYDPEMNLLYVYVQSNRSAFVKSNTNYSDAHLNAIAGDNIDIPCKTTSPKLQPILIKNKEDKVNKASYDSKFGFTIRNLSLDDSDSYKCLIEMNKTKYMVNYELSVHPKQTLTEPKIQTYDVFIKNERKLYLNCIGEMEIYVRYVFDWNTRQQNSSKRGIQQFRKHLDENSILSMSQAMLFTKDNNSGDYACLIKTNYDKNEITKEISITYSKEKIFFSLFTLHISYSHNESDRDIIWMVNMITDKRFRNNLQWFKPNGDEILRSKKYPIIYDLNPIDWGSSLLISNSLEINSLDILDSGNYTLQIRNDYYMTQNLTMILDVIDKPISILTAFEYYYKLNETKEFRCKVTSNPPPNITWNFLRCPNYPSLENSTIVHLTNVTQSTSNNSSYIFESVLTMPIDVSGKITCEACNEVGCDSDTENIFVSDGLGAFGIIGPKESVVKGDNIELICAASIYNYIDEFTWSRLINQTTQPLEETGRLKFVKHNTSFTHRSMLKLYNVQESDATNYVCTGKILNTSNHEILYPLSDHGNYELLIHDPILPHFVKTNMNTTKTRIIDMITEGRNTTILKCYADGLPKPSVIWYKDNVLLKKNNQFQFKNNNQELHITYLMQYDSGKYSCRAVSRLGTNETYQQITVKNTKWYIIDIVLVTTIPILSFILIILTIYFTIKIHREKRKRKELMEAGLLNFEEGALEYLDPKLTIDEQAELLPYDKKWEFPRDRLNLREELGSGNFGVVMKAEAIGICKNEDVTTVAVKMVRRRTDPIYIRALVSELKIMVHLGKHLNVVNLLGACTNNISKYELLVIVEYCRFGNLQNYLSRHRNDFINQINPRTRKHDFTIGMDIRTRNVNVSNDNSPNGNSNIDVTMHNCPETNSDSPEINFLPDCVLNDNLSQPEWRSNDHCNDFNHQNTKPICTQDLLSWAFQVARGMEYLSQRKILHGDLAARNILLAEDNIVKICDFGFAKIMYKESNYKKKIAIPMPIKWMAIESIRNRIFSTPSDVWSFGIMLWEFFTLAETPYPSIDVTILHHKLIEGYRMEQPDYAVDEIYDIMLQCWIAKPTVRPSFTDLVENIGNLLEEGEKMHYITLNNSYMDINMMNLKNGKDDYLMMSSAPDHEVLSSISKFENSLSNETSDSTLYI